MPDDIFEAALREAFGDGADDFSDELRERLRVLWNLGDTRQRMRLRLKIHPSWLDEGTRDTALEIPRHIGCPDCDRTGADYPFGVERCGGTGRTS